MNTTKVTPQLAARLAEADDAEELDIVVELQPAAQSVTADVPTTRAGRIAALKEAFQLQAQPLTEAIEQAGGQVTGQVWLNQTVRARVPAGSLKDLTRLERANSFDVPHTLEAE